MPELVTVSINNSSMHPRTTKMAIDGHILTQYNEKVVLRADTMQGILQAEVDRVNKELESRNEPKSTKAPVMNSCAVAPSPCAPVAAGEVKLNAFEFSNLLSSLKQVGTSSATNKQVLTHMEIHEKLLAMKVHK